MAEPTRLTRCPSLHLVCNTAKGRGVFTSAPISAGTILDVCPALPLAPDEYSRHISHTILNHYTFNWPVEHAKSKGRLQRGTATQAVVFGLGSLFNHSSAQQNVGWTRDVEREVITYVALRDIERGEELCVSYGDRLWFEDADAPRTADTEPEKYLENIEV